MFGETGSLVGVFVPGCRLRATSGDVAGDGFRADEVVLEKYVGVKVLPCPILITGSACCLGERFRLLLPTPFSTDADGVVAGDGGVFNIMRFGVSALKVVGFCLGFEGPNATSIVSFGIVELVAIPEEFILTTPDLLLLTAHLSRLPNPSEEEK